jgi:hypothetical protein
MDPAMENVASVAMCHEGNIAVRKRAERDVTAWIMSGGFHAVTRRAISTPASRMVGARKKTQKILTMEKVAVT